jgi:uncharacterized membrane protein YqgA involved in biofilm formation
MGYVPICLFLCALVFGHFVSDCASVTKAINRVVRIQVVSEESGSDNSRHITTSKFLSGGCHVLGSIKSGRLFQDNSGIWFLLQSPHHSLFGPTLDGQLGSC